MGSYVLIRDEEIEAVDSRNSVFEGNEAESAKHLSQLNLDGGKVQSNVTDVKQRLASLDVFRGLTVALMILVDDAGGALPAINHSPWNGVTLADFVMPFFLFIVGVSLGLVYKRVSDRLVATRKAILRSIKLFLLGIVLQGGYFHGLNDLTFGVDIEHIRWLGILQGHTRRILHWIISSLAIMLFGIFVDILGMPLNKPLYTFSYMCVTSGAAGLMFVAIYLFVDVYGWRRPTMLLEWMGMNALIIYALAACNLCSTAIQGFYWKSPQNNLVNAVEELFRGLIHSKRWAKLAYVLFEILFWCLVAGLLHIKGIYVKL